MKKIIRKDLITYIIIFIITCTIFFPLLQGHFASDSYNIYNMGYYDYAIKYSLNDGRIFMAILGLIAWKTDISINTYVFITLFCALIISNITVMVLSKIIKKYKEPKNIFQEVTIIGISYITIFNFMYLENMYFVECIVMSASVLLFLISAQILVEKQSKYIIKSLILTILGIMLYQGTIGILFTFVFLLTILKNTNNIKQIIIDFFSSGVIGGISVITNLLIIKIVGNVLNMGQSRYGSLANIFNNMNFIIKTVGLVIQECCGLFPENGLVIFLFILTLIVIIYQFKNLNKKNDNTIYKFLAIIFIAIASAYIVNLTTIASITTGRLKYSIGALVGIIFIFLYVETELLENKGILSKATLITLLAFIIINIVNYENIILQHKETNRLEKQEVQKIDEYIQEYEEETGTKITKIIKVPEYNRNKGYFLSTKNRSVFTHNSIRVYWASDGIINLYTKRDLENIKITKETMELYNKEQDNENDYKCIDDTLYIKTYIN